MDCNSVLDQTFSLLRSAFESNLLAHDNQKKAAKHRGREEMKEYKFYNDQKKYFFHLKNQCIWDAEKNIKEHGLTMIEIEK